MEYRVTKYNPTLRNEKGHYSIPEEWTSYSDIGKSVTLEDYLKTEKAYIGTAIAMLQETNCEGLRIVDLENSRSTTNIQRGDLLDLSDLEEAFREVLRENIWCKFEAEFHYVHFGYDYYMYIGTPTECDQSLIFANKSGLFVENQQSPYNN